MIVRPVSFLPSRDFKIHESGHFCIGSIFDLPMGNPEVFNDGSGGIVPFDKASMEQSAAGVELTDFPADTLKRGATQVAAMLLSGHAAEGIAAHVDMSCPIGDHTSDWLKARDIVRKCGLSDLLLLDAWRLSVRILFKIWPIVIDFAKDIPETDNTHETFQIQASAKASAMTPFGALASGKRSRALHIPAPFQQ